MIKRHKLSIIVIYVFLGLFNLIIWLDGYRNSQILLYGLFLSTILIVVLIAISFYREKNLIQLLDRKISFKDYYLLKKDKSWMSDAFFSVLDAQYRFFYDELNKVQIDREEQQAFVYKWVHQMKTPVSILELMIQDGEFLQESLLEETDKLDKGLTLTLNMSRIDSFEKDFIIESTNLKQLVVVTINENKHYFIRNNIFPKVSIDKNLEIKTDKKWLSFMIEQLVVNSIKYTDAEESRLTIFTEVTETAISLCVKDYGIGIESQDLPRIFDPFFTGINGRNHQESTGMGLYLVKKISENLGYSIDVTSEIKKGTLVKISIPIV